MKILLGYSYFNDDGEKEITETNFTTYDELGRFMSKHSFTIIDFVIQEQSL